MAPKIGVCVCARISQYGTGEVALEVRSGRIVFKAWRFGVGLLVSSAPQLRTGADQEASQPGVDDRLQPALLFTGCVTAGLFERVNEATKRVLRVNGVQTEAAPNQGCCGALHARR